MQKYILLYISILTELKHFITVHNFNESSLQYIILMKSLSTDYFPQEQMALCQFYVLYL